MIWFYGILMWLLMELLINAVFHKLSGELNPDEKRFISISKGVLERLFLITGILLGYPQVIIAFGALKIGTRFKNSEKGKVSDDYFLIGNLVSLLAVLLYVWILGFF